MPEYTPAYDSTGAEYVPAPGGGGVEMADRGEGYSPLQPIPMEQLDPLSLVGQCPAITESTGTWLRRGLWYADLDAVVMARSWNRGRTTLFQEYDAVVDQSTGSINAFPIQQIIPIQSTGLGGTSPSYDAGVRLALGRFLFRDLQNRDHTFDMIVFGGPEWQERTAAEAQLTGLQPNGQPAGLVQINPTTGEVRDNRGLQVVPSIDGSGPLRIDDFYAFTSFDGADAMDVEYTSRISSWEWNYNMAQRMRRDRMELAPSGEWVRRASPGFTWDYVAGVRYFNLEEQLLWNATDIRNISTVDDTTDGHYNVATSNDLFGLQLGAGLTYETDRWNVTASIKQGFFINDARAQTSLSYTNANDAAAVALNNYANDLHVNEVSYVAQGSIMGRYHLRPNLSLRAGWEFMYLNGLALAPNQLNFNPAVNQLNASGHAVYHGVSVGTEFFW